MKKLPLIVGGILLVLILLIMISPKTFAPKSPYTISRIRFSVENGKLDVEAAPFPPSEGYILGSDSLGRDILSYIVYGTRLTILLGVLIAIFQFLISIPIGLYAGFGNKFLKSVIKQQSFMFSAIPALLISIILLRLEYFGQLGKQNSVLAFIIVLTIVGWSKIGLILMERVEVINSQPFIKGAVAIGKKRKNIALTNVLPHLAPEIIVLFFMEIARNLSMIMQLGVFGIFVGNLKIIKDSNNGVLTYFEVSFEPEWASMLSTSRTYISVAPWAVLFPALAFFISVLAFNLFGEGLRQLLQEKDSTALISIKRKLSFKKLKKPNSKFMIWILVVLIVFVFVGRLGISEYKFKPDKSIDLPQEQVVIGTDKRDEVSRFIVDYMKKLNIKSLEDEDYIQEYIIKESYVMTEQALQIIGDDHKDFLEPTIDFQILSYSDSAFIGGIYNALRDDLYNITDYSVFENKFVMLNTKFYNDEAINYFIENISSQTEIKGFLLVNENQILKEKLIVVKSEYPIIRITNDIAMKLAQKKQLKIQVESKAKKINTIGKNIVGIYPGVDPYLREEVIMIGMNYNYLSEPEVLEFNLSLMNKLTRLDSNKRSIIFMFVDGTIDEDYNGIIDVADDFPYSSQKIKTYIDLTGLECSKYDQLEFSNKQAPLTRPFPWSVGHHLDKELKKSFEIKELETININGEYYFTKNESDNMMFWDSGIASIIISNSSIGEGKNDLYDIGEIIVEVISLNNY